MTLDRSRWIVRLFFWSLGILDAFTDGSRSHRVPHTGTNLCFFFQATFVFTPLVLLLHLTVYSTAIAALTVAPIYLFSASGYFSFVIAVGTFIALVVFASWLVSYMRDRRFARLMKEEYQENRGPGSVEIAWQYVVAQKRKVCPLISFNGARS